MVHLGEALYGTKELRRPAVPSVAFSVRTNNLNIGNSRSSHKVVWAEKWKSKLASASKRDSSESSLH
jgi:hypothetical protein